MSTKKVMLDCDTYIVRALELERENVNRFNSREGFARVDVCEVARGVLADWAISQLLTQPEPRKNRGSRALNLRVVN